MPVVQLTLIRENVSITAESPVTALQVVQDLPVMVVILKHYLHIHKQDIRRLTQSYDKNFFRLKIYM